MSSLSRLSVDVFTNLTKRSENRWPAKTSGNRVLAPMGGGGQQLPTAWRLLRHQHRVDGVDHAVVGDHVGAHHLGIVHHRTTDSVDHDGTALHRLDLT